jgi:hypothetical protein
MIEIRFHKDGKSTIKVDGVKGSRCTDMTKGILKALGGKTVKEEKTPEFYEEQQGTGQNLYNQ